MSKIIVLVFFAIGFVVFSLIKSAKTGFVAAKHAVMYEEERHENKDFDAVKRIIYEEANSDYKYWKTRNDNTMLVLNHSLEVTEKRLKKEGYVMPKKDIAALVLLAIVIGNQEDRELLKIMADHFLAQYGIDTSYYDGSIINEKAFI